MIAVAPVLSIVHRRMTERGGKQAELSRKYTSCLPALLSCFRVVVQSDNLEADGTAPSAAELEPEPSIHSTGSDADARQLHAASTLTALIDFVKKAAILANEQERKLEQTDGVGPGQQLTATSDEEVHLARYLLIRFCLSLLGAKEHFQSTVSAMVARF